MQAIDASRFEAKFEQIWAKEREDHKHRCAEFGFAADCSCSWCGDTGMTREGAICQECETGDRKARDIARIAAWPHLVPTVLGTFTLESCPNRKLAARVATWLAGDPIATGQNLVIQGKVGVGKTGAAIGALRELHMAGKSVAYWSAPDLMDQFRQEERIYRGGRERDDSHQIPTMTQLKRVDCLLLDDVGGERVTDYVAERMFVLIDGRYLAQKPTILTTNRGGIDLKTHLGERNASRIRQNYLSAVGEGADLRQPTPERSDRT